MKKATVLMIIILLSMSFVFAISNAEIYDTSWEYNVLKHDKNLAGQFREAYYEIEFDDDYSFSLELEFELKVKSNISSRDDILTFFAKPFSEHKSFSINGYYKINADGTISITDKSNNTVMTLKAVKKGRILSVTFQDGTTFDFKKS